MDEGSANILHKPCNRTNHWTQYIYANHEWTAKDVFGRSLMINNRQGIIQKQNTKDKRSIALIKRPGTNIV